MKTATRATSAGIEIYLKELRLPTVRECYDEVALQAQQESLGYREFLFELLERESEVRQIHRLERRLQESRLPPAKTLENFDLKRLPVKLQQQIAVLLDGSFLDRREN